MRSEKGFTLIELMIASSLAILVLLIAGGMVLSSFSADRNVQQSRISSSHGQLVAESVTSGVRHASRVSLTSPTVDSQVLMALIVEDAVADPAIAHCQAWYFGDGQIRTTTSPTAIAVPLAPADVSNWSQLAEGVEAVGVAPVFTVPDPAAVAVGLVFQVKGDSGITLLIETTAVSRQPANAPSEVENQCF